MANTAHPSDARARLLLIVLCAVACTFCVLAVQAALRVNAVVGRDGDERLGEHLEVLRGALLARSMSPFGMLATRGDRVSTVLAECRTLAAGDADQSRRLDKLDRLLTLQSRLAAARLAEPAGDTERWDLRGDAYALLASHAWIDAMQRDIDTGAAAHQMRQTEAWRTLRWTGGAALLACLLFGLALARRLRQTTRHGHARISRLEARANCDPLTGLPNRRLLHDRLDQARRRSARRGAHAAVIAIDLDGFKPVNDTFGHAVGDRVLKRVGRRLQLALRDEDTVCRLGGDEFVVILGEVSDPVAAVRRARDLIARISRPIRHRDQVLRVGASAGVALYPEDAEEATELLECADQALYAAKHNGRGGVVTVGEMEMARREAPVGPAHPAADGVLAPSTL